MNRLRPSLFVLLSSLGALAGCARAAGGEARRAPDAAPAAAAEAAPARPTPTTGSEGVGAPPFTTAQVERGLSVFRRVCSECHYRSDFRGPQFQFEWRRRTVGDFYGVVTETMPEKDPGSLDPQQYADVVAFVLSLNGHAAGAQELVPDEAALGAYSMAPVGGGTRP